MKTQTNISTASGIAYTLKEAIIEAIEGLKSGFSVHQITEAVRKAVNEGEYALPGFEATQPSSIKYFVNHDDVKSIVNDLLADGTLDRMGLESIQNGAFRIFNFKTATTAVTTDANVATNVTVADDDADATVSPVAQRIKGYIERNGRGVTLRQIHSALKINGLSCKDLVSVVESAGFTVSVGTLNKFSTYTVS